jgi:archaellum biogenesis ATPase FlaH
MNTKAIIAKQKEYIEFLEQASDNMYQIEAHILREELAALEAKEEKPNRVRKEPSIKICAGCGSFAHGNPGHDIT